MPNNTKKPAIQRMFVLIFFTVIATRQYVVNNNHNVKFALHYVGNYCRFMCCISESWRCRMTSFSLSTRVEISRLATALPPHHLCDMGRILLKTDGFFGGKNASNRYAT